MLPKRLNRDEPQEIVPPGYPPTDRHLIRNEADETPVMHEPVRRPRSVRDLDHIPDDLD